MSTTEDPVLPTVTETKEVTSAPPPKATKAKKATKEPKQKKIPAPKKRTSAAHPPYYEMIKDAIATLAEKTGSSQYAITKFIEDKQKNLPANFRKLLLVQLKKCVANDKLVKIKSSYKLPSKLAAVSAPIKKKPAQAEKPKPKVKTAASSKEKKAKTVASKAKPSVKLAAAKTKAGSTVAKPKAKLTAKSKAVSKATMTSKAATKRKTPEKSKVETKKPVKASRTSLRTTPGKKAAPVKAVKPKTVKSPAKKVAIKGKK